MKLDEKKIENILEYKKQGMSNRKIAAEFNVSEGTVRNYLKKYNAQTGLFS